MDVMEGIYTRRSIRKFTGEPLPRETLLEIMKAGTWAPSGLNNQPWRFALIQDEALRRKLASFTTYGTVIMNAPACIAVFADRGRMYHDVKDHQAIGACIENMLLAAHALGIGAVWLGEILKNAGAVRSLLELPESLELMAVVACGNPQGEKRTSSRYTLEEVLIKEV
jgi:nitroreductase